MRNYKGLIIITILLLIIGLAGCAPKTAPTPPAPAPQAPSGNMPMEAPTPIINQMNQTVDDINAKVKANQIPQAKQSGSNLVALNDRLAPHFTDTAFRDNLHHAVLALNDEVSKATPNAAEVDKKAQAVKGLLQQTPAKIMKM